MKKLSKQDEKRRDELVEALRLKQTSLEEAVTKYNETMNVAFEPVQSALDDFNGAVTDAESFRDDVHSEQSSHYDDKSDRWKEGEKGTAYETWKGSWETTLDQVEIEKPEELADPELEHADNLENLPSEPE